MGKGWRAANVAHGAYRQAIWDCIYKQRELAGCTRWNKPEHNIQAVFGKETFAFLSTLDYFKMNAGAGISTQASPIKFRNPVNPPLDFGSIFGSFCPFHAICFVFRVTREFRVCVRVILPIRVGPTRRSVSAAPHCDPAQNVGVRFLSGAWLITCLHYAWNPCHRFRSGACWPGCATRASGSRVGRGFGFAWILLDSCT